MELFPKQLFLINSFTFIIFIFISKISKIQSDEILTNITYFNSKTFREGHFAQNKDGDMILEYSSGIYRLFFGLKKDGNYFYDNENHYKIIQIRNKNEELFNRNESNNIFVYLKNDINKTKQYLLSISASNSVSELHDLETDEYSVIETKKIFKEEIYSYIIKLFNFEDQKGNEYLVAYTTRKSLNVHFFHLIRFSL